MYKLFLVYFQLYSEIKNIGLIYFPSVTQYYIVVIQIYSRANCNHTFNGLG